MFANIGQKIKKLALAICLVGIFTGFIGGIACYEITANILLGIAIMFFGGILSWMGSWYTYGFGELINYVGDINNSLKLLRNDKQQHKNMNQGNYAYINSLKAQGKITDEENETLKK